MKYFLSYLKSVIVHKWYVFVECCKLGIPWIGIIHDLSKFHPAEFGRYARWHFGGNKDKRQWVIAWHHHMHHNKHHPEHYLLAWRGDPEYYNGIGEKTGTDFIVILPMPHRYLLEMVAEFRGGAHESGKLDPLVYYTSQRDKMLLHPNTRTTVEFMLGYNWSVLE